MREVKRTALVSQPPGVLFALINDIEAYPQFLPWCTHAHVLERTDTHILATIGVRQGALSGEFTTRNALEPERAITMQLVKGPFSALEGRWLLTPIAPNGCRVDFTVKFAFKNRLTAMLLEPLFAQTIGSLVDAFVQRARALP
jgi:ribosome-associated toxin RatA of RatAB toxin-antitoxin module